MDARVTDYEGRLAKSSPNTLGAARAQERVSRRAARRGDPLSWLVPAEVLNAIIDKKSGGRDGKVYLAPGESAPDGVEVITTPRGARYYINPDHKPREGVVARVRGKIEQIGRILSLRHLSKDHVTSVKGIGGAGVGAGIHQHDSHVVDVKEGILPHRDGFNDKRVFHKTVEVEGPGEICAFEVGELIKPGWMPEIAYADLGKGPGHVMSWVDNYGMEGETAHAPRDKGNWNEQKIVDAADLWVLDCIIGNTDRHDGNYIEDEADGGHLRAIDNGFAFHGAMGELFGRFPGPDYADRAGHSAAFWGEVQRIGDLIVQDPEKLSGILSRARDKLEEMHAAGVKGNGFGRADGWARTIRNSGLDTPDGARAFGQKLKDEFTRRKEFIERAARAAEEQKKREAEARENAKDFWVENRVMRHGGKEYRALEVRPDGFVRVKPVGEHEANAQVLDADRAARWALEAAQNEPDKAKWKVRADKTKIPPQLQVGKQYHVDGETLNFVRMGHNGDFVFERPGGGGVVRHAPDKLADIADQGKFRPGTPPPRPEPGEMPVPGDVVDLRLDGNRRRDWRGNMGKEFPFVKWRVERINDNWVELMQPGANAWGKRYRVPREKFDAAWAAQHPGGKGVKRPEGTNVFEIDPADPNVPNQLRGRARWRVAGERNQRQRIGGRWEPGKNDANGNWVPGRETGGEVKDVPMILLEPADMKQGGMKAGREGRWVEREKWDALNPVNRPKQPKEKAPPKGKAGKPRIVVDRFGGAAHFAVVGERVDPMDGRRKQFRLAPATPGGNLKNEPGNEPFWANEADVQDAPKAGRPAAAKRPGGFRGGRPGTEVNVRGEGPGRVVGFRAGGERHVAMPNGEWKWVGQDQLTTRNPRPQGAGDRTEGGRKVGAPPRTPELRGGMKLRIPLHGADTNVELVGPDPHAKGRWVAKWGGAEHSIGVKELHDGMRAVAQQNKHPVIGWAKRPAKEKSPVRQPNTKERAFLDGIKRIQDEMQRKPLKPNGEPMNTAEENRVRADLGMQPRKRMDVDMDARVGDVVQWPVGQGPFAGQGKPWKVMATRQGPRGRELRVKNPNAQDARGMWVQEDGKPVTRGREWTGQPREDGL